MKRLILLPQTLISIKRTSRKAPRHVGENVMTKTVTTLNVIYDNYYRQSEFALFFRVLGSLTNNTLLSRMR